MEKKEKTTKQVIKCPCGKMFAACVDGWQDKEWNDSVGEYMAKGCTSEMIKGDVGGELVGCDCPNMDGSLKDQTKIDFNQTK